MSAFPRPAVAVLLLITSLAAAALLLNGCGKSSKSTAPNGDANGDHLLVFASDRDSPGSFDLALYDLDQGGFRSLSNLNSTVNEIEPCLSNDGNFLFFASNRSGGAGGYDLYLYDRVNVGLLPTPGLNTAADEVDPRFTYDSGRVVFARDSSASFRIRMYEPLGDTLVKLPGIDAPGSASDRHPAPDLHGDRIAFQSDRAGAPHIYVWDRASGVLNLPDLVSTANDVEPALSSDGRWLAFASDRSGGAGGYDIYLYDLTNHVFVRTPNLNTALDERHPSVSADGTVIALQAIPSAGVKNEVYVWTASDSTRAQLSGMSSTGEDQMPYLRWR